MQRRVSLLLFLVWLAAALPAVADEAPILSAKDVSLVRNAFKAMDIGRAGTAAGLQRHMQDPLAVKLVTWRRLTGRNGALDFNEIEEFRTTNPGWPHQERLLRRAEQALPPAMPAAEVIAWFAGREPVSALGAARLGAAELATGAGESGTARIRAAWVDGNFSRSESRAFYRRHRKLLRMADHVKRLDRLLWDGRRGPARRMMYIVKPDWQKLAMARIALRQRAGNVDYLIKRVPAGLQQHAGLIYERLRWRRRKNKDTALELAKNLPTARPYPEKWWEELSTVTRRALRKGHVTDAYRIAKNHGLQPGGAAYAEAEWLSGWIALRFLKDDASALDHFRRMWEAVKFPVSIARAAYWAGRAAEAKGDDEAAVEWYRKAAQHPLTYYGQLAFARLRPGRSLKLPGVVKLPDEPSDDFDNHELVRVIKILADISAHDHVKAFVQSLMELSDKPQWWARTAQLARLSGRPDLSIRIAKKADRNGTPLPREAFPVLKLPDLPKTAKVDRPEVPLVLAVIRQESAFRISARSHAGARGLMQVMPATAKNVAKELRLRYSRLRLSTSPKYNMTLGQAYLGAMLKEFKGSYVLALAAYNAGPHRAKRWIKLHGDPREKDVNAVDWVELIPFDETRNYVQRVLENLQIYRLGLAKTEVALGLESDLHFSSN